MKKYTHPQVIETVIQLKDGSTYIKRWNFFRKSLPLEVDFTKHIKWQQILLKKKKNANI